ncbi:MAG: SBBP repeat-containing protein [Deltaproteobacteria bacterium]|nr:SBBP repeat-containing protein [Deltaproteobacteria bacterium]
MSKRFIGKFLTTVLFLGVFTTGAFADVMQEWVATYNGPGNTVDQAKKMAVDAEGNVYVTGTSGGSTSDWLDLNNDIVTIKYNSAGEKLWERRYNGPGGAGDGGTAIAVDGDGNVYVAGYSSKMWFGEWGKLEYVTIKYNSNGDEVWIRQYAPSWHWYNYPVGIGVGSNGDVYVAGTSPYVVGDSDIVTFKYDSDGVMKWMRAYDGPGGDDYASAMTVDAGGNVYIAGTSGDRYASRASYNYGILKYDTDGVLQWVAAYGGTGSEDVPSAIAVDANGNVYVTGRGRVEADYDYATVKFDSGGIQQWVARYSATAGGGVDIPTAIAIDSGGNVYVTGYSGDPARYTTIKYDTDGTQLWLKEYIGPGELGDVATSLVLDNDGNAYVTGYSHGGTTGYDFATIKYWPDGTEEWVERYNGSGNGDDYSNAIAIDKAGNVYVAGGSYGTSANLDYTVIKYSPVIVVMVDIKPGSYPNSMNLDSTGVIPVSILSTSDFDARNIDPLTVKFGPAGATEAHGMGHIEDVNADGLLDIILHFNTAETGIQEGETSASLTGKTLDGKNIIGSDSIRIVGKR